jgi:exonuclease VII large subunit
MATTTANNVYDDVFQNLRKAAETNLKMQQEVFKQWGAMWPGFPSPQSVWLDKVRDFQHQWATTVSDLARKHRDVLDRQYQAALESLEEALRVTESSNPEEFRARTEQLVRKTLDCVREVSETQMNEIQEAMNRWSELATKVGK